MKNWLAPLGIFVLFQIGLLFIYLFMPAVDTSVLNLKTETAGISGFVWGWTWLMTNGVVRLLIYILYELLCAFAVGMAFLRSKKA